MINLTNAKRYLLILTLSLNLFSIFGQVTIKGSLWENGIESECNWYFKDHLACLEFISKESNGSILQTRTIMNAQSKQMTIITHSSSGQNCLTVSADSIQTNISSTPLFVTTKEVKNFDGFGDCKKIQAKSHTQESLLYFFENDQINLSLFNSFLKGDAGFEWLGKHTTNGFPVQSITVDALGNLKRSFLATSVESKVNEQVFEIICD